MKNRIERIRGKGSSLMIVIKQKNTKQQSRLFCDKIEYLYRKRKPSLDHHLFFYMKGELICKVWLKDKPYKSIDEAMEAVGFVLIPSVWDNIKTKNQKREFIRELREIDQRKDMSIDEILKRAKKNEKAKKRN